MENNILPSFKFTDSINLESAIPVFIFIKKRYFPVFCSRNSLSRYQQAEMEAGNPEQELEQGYLEQENRNYYRDS